MGITASVSCNCYKEGKTTPCPFGDEFIYNASQMPALETPFNIDEDEAQERYRKFRVWLTTCCEHPDMNDTLAFIASWKGHQAFIEAVEALNDPKSFSLLLSHLPDGDDGVTSPELAQKMLDEIALFEARQSTLSHAVLMDTERGDVVSMGSQVLNGVLTMDRQTGYDIGFNAEGFFIRDRWEMNRVLFIAKRVEQRMLLPEHQQVEYVDLETGRSFVCNTPFGKWYNGEDGVPRMYLQHFHIEDRPAESGRFAYVTDPLRRVLQASVRTGNPVRWH